MSRKSKVRATALAMTRTAVGWQIDGPFGSRLVCCGRPEDAAAEYLSAGAKEKRSDG